MTTSPLTLAASAVYRWAQAADFLGESFLVAKADEAAQHHGFKDAMEVLHAVEERTSARWFHHSAFYHLEQIIAEREDGYRGDTAYRPQ